MDVVLNALAAEAIPMGLSCLAEFGRFIEIGKRDIYQNSRIPLWPLRRNASFHVVAMDAVFSGDEALTRQMLGGDCRAGRERRAPSAAFPRLPGVPHRCGLPAHGEWQTHRQSYRVVSGAFVPRRGEPLAPAFEVKPDGSYLITGAFGGFGKVLAEWLVDCGARHLVLSSRSGAATPEAEAFWQNLHERGVEVRVVQADVGSPDDVKRLLAEIRVGRASARGRVPPRDGHRRRAARRAHPRAHAHVMAPKAHGAWLLHEATREMKLDCFVMFSSVSSIFGNPAQGNYGAANAFLDSLAHHRRALGLPALTMNWGVLGGEGYVARNERVAEFLARQGTTGISPGEVMSLLESFLAGNTQVPRSAWIGRSGGNSFRACRRIRCSSASSPPSKVRNGRRDERLAKPDRIGRAR